MADHLDNTQSLPDRPDIDRLREGVGAHQAAAYIEWLEAQRDELMVPFFAVANALGRVFWTGEHDHGQGHPDDYETIRFEVAMELDEATPGFGWFNCMDDGPGRRLTKAAEERGEGQVYIDIDEPEPS